MMDINFFRNKKILITGHNGFKGSWLCKILLTMGAEVYGYSLLPFPEPNLFGLIGLSKDVNSYFDDIRDFDNLYKTFVSVNPEIVIHMAAQPIVRDSYKNPRYTYETNVMGTVNILECIRLSDSVKSFLNVTTDKVYENKEWVWGYRENEPLNGFDPYSNSKSCSELVTDSYKNSFFVERDTAISTARAGNVIGGGDFSKDRIIPDCVRAVHSHENIIVRNPYAVRPYQHVLECLNGYLLLVQKQYENKEKYEGCYNFGPDEKDCVTTGTLVNIFCKIWGGGSISESREDNGPHEASFLKLDCSKSKAVLGWKPKWNIENAVKNTIEIYKAIAAGTNPDELIDTQINSYFD